MASVSFKSFKPAQFEQYSQKIREQKGEIAQQQVGEVAKHFKVPVDSVLKLRETLLASANTASEQVGKQTEQLRDMAKGGGQPVGTAQIKGVGVNPFMFSAGATAAAQVDKPAAPLDPAQARALRKAELATDLAALTKQQGSRFTGGLDAATQNFWVAAAKSGEIRFENLPEAARNNLAVVAAALSNSPEAYNFKHVGEKLRDNAALVKLMVGFDGEALEFASDRLRGDKATVLAAVKQNGEGALEFALGNLAGDLDVARAALNEAPYSYRFIKDPAKSDPGIIRDYAVHSWSAFDNLPKDVVARLTKDPQLVLEHVSEHPRAFRTLAKQYSDHDAIVRAAVSGDAELLELASDRLKADKSLVMTAVKQNGRAWQYGAPDVRASRDVMLAAIAEKENGWVAVHDIADDPKANQFLKDRSFVMDAIPLNERVFWKAEAFQDDREVVKLAMQHHGGLTFAKKFQADPEIAALAVAAHPGDIKEVSPKVPNYNQLVNAALDADPWTILDVPKRFGEDRDRAMDLVKRNGALLAHVADKFATDPEFIKVSAESSQPASDLFVEKFKGNREAVLALAQSNSNAFLDDYLTPLLKGFSNDREIMLGAIRQDPQLFAKASAALKKDPKFVMAAIEARGEAIQFAPKEFQQNADFALAALKDDKFRLDTFGVSVDFGTLLGDRDFARKLIAANGARLRDLSAELRGDPEIVALATAQAWRNITFASEKLQTDPAFLARVGVPSAD